jgi:hypothetical protein
MKTKNSESLLESLRSRLPDADERLMSAREASLAELDAYERVERALGILSRPQRAQVAGALETVARVLGQMDAEMTVTVSFSDERRLSLPLEDLIAAVHHEDREPMVALT